MKNQHINDGSIYGICLSQKMINIHVSTFASCVASTLFNKSEYIQYFKDQHTHSFIYTLTSRYQGEREKETDRGDQTLDQ